MHPDGSAIKILECRHVVRPRSPSPDPARQRRGDAARRRQARRRRADHRLAGAQHARAGFGGGAQEGRRRDRPHRLRSQHPGRRPGVGAQPPGGGGGADDRRPGLPRNRPVPDRRARRARLPADARPVGLRRQPRGRLARRDHRPAARRHRPDRDHAFGRRAQAPARRRHSGGRDLGSHADADRHAGRFLPCGRGPRGRAIPPCQGSPPAGGRGRQRRARQAAPGRLRGRRRRPRSRPVSASSSCPHRRRCAAAGPRWPS